MTRRPSIRQYTRWKRNYFIPFQRSLASVTLTQSRSQSHTDTSACAAGCCCSVPGLSDCWSGTFHHPVSSCSAPSSSSSSSTTSSSSPVPPTSCCSPFLVWDLTFIYSSLWGFIINSTGGLLACTSRHASAEVAERRMRQQWW